MTDTDTFSDADTSTALESLSLDAWQELVASHSQSTPFHHRNWIELIQDQYRFPLTIPAIRRNGEVAAALPFLQTRTLLGRRKLIALPFTDCIRPLAIDEAAEQSLIDAISDSIPSGCRSTVVRTDRHHSKTVSTSPSVLHTLDTSRPLDELEGCFESMLRRNLRRAERRGLRFERSEDIGAIDEFYRLHLKTRKKLGVPIQPRKFFTRLHHWILLKRLGYIGLVKKENTVISAGVFLTYNQTVIYKYVASDPSALEHRPNEWLTYHAIREATENGMTIFDFGLSRRTHEGLRRFKRKWGTVESDLFEYRLAHHKCGAARESRSLALLSTVIRHTPPFVCRGIGEMFYRYSP